MLKRRGETSATGTFRRGWSGLRKACCASSLWASSLRLRMSLLHGPERRRRRRRRRHGARLMDDG